MASYSDMFGPGVKHRGRPKGSGTLTKPEYKSTKPARISPELWIFLQSQRQEGETMSQTIFRLIRQANHKSINAQKKVDALQERLQEVKALCQYEIPLLNDYCEAN